jgi:hypothetical protein
LVKLHDESKIDVENIESHKYCVGYLCRKLVSIGIERFIKSWNHHRIPGKSKQIPLYNYLNNNKITPVPESKVPEVNDLMNDYITDEGGNINDNMDDLKPFDSYLPNLELHELFSNIEEEDYLQLFSDCINTERVDSLLLMIQQLIIYYDLVKERYY